ncbi:MAG: hypothetical protein EAZ43_10610 [Betaproteobacteria bacterium]|nr:MAG: hypothetical protein EAZ43_10610 [Betaproteobacteria bacterium]
MKYNNTSPAPKLAVFAKKPLRVAVAMACALAFTAVSFNGVTLAQVGTAGSREERQSDARNVTPNASAKPATPADKALLDVQFQALIDAYERGDVGFFQAKIDPGMPGYSRVLDAMRRDATSQTRPRLLFTDQTWSIGENVAMLQAVFQKRYFDARNLNPELVTGRVVILLSRDGDLWRISAITGDSPFESRAVAPCHTGTVRIVSPANANAEPFFVEIDDADLAGLPSIQADVITDRGDREFITLNALNPDGLFRAQVNARRLTAQGAAVAGNGQIELIGDAVVTARYNDQCVAISRNQQIVQASDTRRDPGTLGQFACRLGSSATFVSLATSSSGGATNLSLTIELFDPDLAGLPSIDVLLRTASGDSEIVTLGASGNLGRFLTTSVPARVGGNVVVGARNGTLDIGAATGFTVEYLDQRPGAVGRTQLVTSDCGALPSGYQTAQLACNINANTNSVAVGQTTQLPISLSVTDPDLALGNPAFVNVTVRNSVGDSEIIRLDPAGSGRYAASSLSARQGSAAPNNGVLEFPSLGSISAEYIDTTNASGVASQVVGVGCGALTQGNTLATLEYSVVGIGPQSPFPFNGPAVQGNCSITVRDPDLAGQGSVSVDLRAVQQSSGRVDTETLTLPAVSPGVFSRTSCSYQGYVSGSQSVAALYVPVPNNGSINLGGGATQITVSFTDPSAPGGGSQIVSRSVTVNN